MKAVLCKRYGKTDKVVELNEIPKPKPSDNEVLIEVHAASINPIDYKIQQGAAKAVIPLKLPFVMGYDVSGVVVELGSEVKQFKIGDEVFSRTGSSQLGAFAQYVAVEEEYIAFKPKNVDHEQAASIPLVALTSWQALLSFAKLTKGQKVLIHAGSGGVGSIAIQLAKSIGAEVTTTTSTTNVEMVSKLGADHVIDYKKERFEALSKGFDVVFETLGGESQAKSFTVLKEGGFLASIVGIPSSKWAKDEGLPFFMPPLFNMLNWKNNRLAKKHKVGFEMVFMTPNGKQLQEIADLISNEKIKPVVDRIFPLEQAKNALLYSQSGRAKGKIVLKVK